MPLKGVGMWPQGGLGGNSPPRIWCQCSVLGPCKLYCVGGLQHKMGAQSDANCGQMLLHSAQVRELPAEAKGVVANGGGEASFDGPVRFRGRFWVAATRGQPPDLVPRKAFGTFGGRP